ncbi:MAG TPA: MraY family glycosyltransferase [Patescibacteria group bacterium]|nr:MraY family glycosyltransferase [Patescibacteria group bacterium]
MTVSFFFWFLIALAGSFALTPLVARVAVHSKVVDRPDNVRRLHARPIPLGGGLAPYAALAICLCLLLLGDSSAPLTSGAITIQNYVGFLAGGFILMVGGTLDDRYRLPPRWSFLFPVLAAGTVVGFGIEVTKLTNPFGGIFFLEAWQSDFLVFFWLLVLMYTTKLLDGLDGLSTGVTTIGTFFVLLLTLTPVYFQGDVALFSSIAFGSLLGFLFWNFYPAKIFLGEGGSTFMGYLLGTLAVISGGKLAVALLALGIPLFDAAWVILRRLSRGGWRAAVHGDRKHLHHRLLDLGWSQRRVVLSYYALAAGVGSLALFLQSGQKFLALIFLIVGMAAAAGWLIRQEKQVEGLKGSKKSE